MMAVFVMLARSLNAWDPKKGGLSGGIHVLALLLMPFCSGIDFTDLILLLEIFHPCFACPIASMSI